MTVKALTDLGFSAVTLPDPDREIDGVYIGDLLSWVMGRASAGNAWLTIMSNKNIVAVASLADAACIIVTEGVELDDEITSLSSNKGINILSFAGSTYDAAVLLHDLL